MPPLSHWIAQFALAVASMFGILLAVDVLKGTQWIEAWPSALLWAVATSSIFIGSRYHKARKGIRCGMCNDLPAKK